MKTNLPVMLQLYTVRAAFAEDWRGTLKKISEIGYDGVEFASLPQGESPEDVAGFLNELNLTASGIMFKLEEFEENRTRCIDVARTLGTNNLIIPCLTVPESAEDWEKIACRMEKIGQQLSVDNMILHYHNHAFEFADYDGKTGYDILTENTTPDNVHLEVDTYWVKYGGFDPAEMIEKHSGRILDLHVKDIKDDQNQSFAEVGSGILDWSAIFTAAEKAGVKKLVVEQDTCPGDPLDSIRKSLKFLKMS